MLDKDLGKKMIEKEHLFCFLKAYAIVTGISMSVVSNGESPDFICARPAGEHVGVELARSPHDYEMAIWDRIWTGRMMSTPDLLDAVHMIVGKKEQKRQSAHWRTPSSTILVIELLDYKSESLEWTRDTALSGDYAHTGFLEIWLADFSTLEAYGEVRLIGLYPPAFWGLHHRPAFEGKPYG
jgi:hypothetical protein